MSDKEELNRLRQQARKDRQLLEQAARVLAEIDRNVGLSDEQADGLAAVRLRVEGRERASLEDLLAAAGEIGGKRRLEDALPADEEPISDWPVIEEEKKDWPGLR
jgi:hypothetical protein